MNKLIKKYLPNFLTTLRLLVVPFFWFNFLNGNALISTILFASACTTDALDGFLARKWKAESKYGKMADPIADKLLVSSSLLLCGVKYNLAMLIPFLLELSIATVNVINYCKDLDFEKIKPLKFKDKINYIIKNGKNEVKEIGRKKTIVLMATASLAIMNTNFNHLFDNILNFLVGATATLESFTLYSYIEKKQNNNIQKKDQIITESKDSEIKNGFEISNKKNMYERLKKELQFLEENKIKKEEQLIYKKNKKN